jgi:hypothetical protein
MINFKDSRDQAPSAFAVLGILLILGSAIVSLFFSRGIDANEYARKSRRDQAALTQRSLVAKSDKSVFVTTIEKYEIRKI